MKCNAYQRSFFEYVANMQEDAVASALDQHKLNESDRCEEIRSLLYDATGNVLIYLMELIDGYSAFSDNKLDIINPKTAQSLKNGPFIELHDAICDYIKLE